MPIYDDQQPENSHDYPLIDSDRYDPTKKKSLDNEDLGNRETAGVGTDSTGADEKSGLFRGNKGGGRIPSAGKEMFDATDNFLPPSARVAKFLGSKFTKKNSTVGGIVGATIGIGIFAFSIFSGPLQFVHLSQLLQKFHLQRNEDFNDSRAARLLYHGVVTGKIQNARLGIVGNYAADKWEKRLFKETGMRPIYTSTGRYMGMDLVDQDKALSSLLDTNELNDRTSKRLQSILGEGAEIRNAGDTPGNVRPRDAVGNDIDPNSKILDLSSLSFKDRRFVLKTLGKVTNTHGIASGPGSRLLIKRGGVDFHFMNKIKDRYDKSRDQRLTNKEIKKEEEKKRESYVLKGVNGLKGMFSEKTKDDDGDGSPDSVEPGDEETSKTVSDALKDFKNSGALKTAKGPAIVIGVSCGVKAYGDSLQEFRVDNTIKPAMRLGMGIGVSVGDQVKTNKDFDLQNLRNESEYLYDKGDKSTGRPASSWSNAESIRAEQGLPGGKKMSPEANLANKGEKPELFKIVDSIPGLGATCGAIDAATGVWGVRHILGAVNSVTEGAINAALGTAGTSTDELLQDSFKLLSGKSIDPNSKGADFGNLANLGTFFGGTDLALSTGARSLSPAESVRLKEDQLQYEHFAQTQKSFGDRYLNIYDSSSFVASIGNKLPSSFSALSSTLSNPLNMFSSIFTGFSGPRASAASQYDYGVPQFGFSLDEQEDPKFEDPYENARIVEPQLDSLNDKYGKCFSMSVNVDAEGPHIETDNIADPFAVAKDNDCKDSSEIFQRYRFYLADTVNALSLACYEGSKEACQEVGAEPSGSGGEEDTSGSVDGNVQELAQKLLDNKKVTFPYTDSQGLNARAVMEEIAKSGKGQVNGTNASNRGEKVEVKVNMLKALAEYAENEPIAINAITNATHSATSNHYRGTAVDLGCSPGLNRTKFDKIAQKYGGKNNGEVCPGNAHWHYDF